MKKHNNQSLQSGPFEVEVVNNQLTLTYNQN